MKWASCPKIAVRTAACAAALQWSVSRGQPLPIATAPVPRTPVNAPSPIRPPPSPKAPTVAPTPPPPSPLGAYVGRFRQSGASIGDGRRSCIRLCRALCGFGRGRWTGCGGSGNRRCSGGGRCRAAGDGTPNAAEEIGHKGSTIHHALPIAPSGLLGPGNAEAYPGGVCSGNEPAGAKTGLLGCSRHLRVPPTSLPRAANLTGC